MRYLFITDYFNVYMVFRMKNNDVDVAKILINKRYTSTIDGEELAASAMVNLESGSIYEFRTYEGYQLPFHNDILEALDKAIKYINRGDEIESK